MPVYEYRCTNGHTFEVIQSMSEDPLKTCEVCGAPVQRVMHSPAVHFKGSGFYNTDYGTRNRQREKAADAAADGDKAAAKSSESSDSKPAADKPATEKAKTEKAAGKKPD